MTLVAAQQSETFESHVARVNDSLFVFPDVNLTVKRMSIARGHIRTHLLVGTKVCSEDTELV